MTLWKSRDRRGPILARALSVVKVHLMRERAAFRFRSQAAISRRSRLGLSILRSRHWPRRTPISISTMLSQLDRAIATILVIVTFELTRPGRDGLTRLADK